MRVEVRGFKYLRPGAEPSGPTHNIVGQLGLDDIISNSPFHEADMLRDIHQQMQAHLRNGGVITSRGALFPFNTPLFGNTNTERPYMRSTGSFLKDGFGVDIEQLGIDTHEQVYFWNSQLAKAYETKRYAKHSVAPQYVTEEGERIDLIKFSNAFGEFIKKYYEGRSIVPTFSAQAISRCFMIEIFEALRFGSPMPASKPQLQLTR